MSRRGRQQDPEAASWFGKSLQELDGQDWGDPPHGSYVVRTSHALRRKPLTQLDDEELRLALRQEIGLRHLIPFVLWRLGEDPFRSGDYYPSDVLIALLALDRALWLAEPGLLARARALALAVVDAHALASGADQADIAAACALFLADHPG